MQLSSPQFSPDGMIPRRYTCDGIDVNPPIHIDGVPPDTKSLAIIVEDLDSPAGPFVHWLACDIPPTDHIGEDSAPGKQFENSFHMRGYAGPCPTEGTHRYVFHAFALDTMLNIAPDSERATLERAMRGHILDEAALVGRYRR